MNDEEILKYKQRGFISPQLGLFVCTQFDPNDIGLSLHRVDGWLDWRLNLLGWQLGAWIERTDMKGKHEDRTTEI